MDYTKIPYGSVKDDFILSSEIDKKRGSIMMVVFGVVVGIVSTVMTGSPIGILMGLGVIAIGFLLMQIEDRKCIFGVHNQGIWIGRNNSYNLPDIGFVKYEWIKRFTVSSDYFCIYFNSPEEVLNIFPKTTLIFAGALPKDEVGNRYLKLPVEYFNRDLNFLNAINNYIDVDAS